MNRYEREIEEILRNLDQPGTGSRRGTKSGDRPQKKPGIRIARPRFSLTPAEWFLLTAIVCALIAGGYAFTLQRRDLFTLILVLIAVVCIILVACSQIAFQPRRPQSYRHGNIIITPLRRNPFNWLKVQWNLFKLRMRYRHQKED